MQLIYMWVEDYKNIKRTGFSFSDKYKVRVNSNSEEYDVLIEENNLNVESLLFGENISLSAIVGDNGVGKSTLIDLIRIMLFDQKRIKNKDVGFSIWLQGNKFIKCEFSNKQVVINGAAVENVIDEKEFSLIYYSDTLDIKHYSDNFDDGENVETHIDEEDWDSYFDEPEDQNIEKRLSFQNRYMEQYNVSTIFLLKNSKNEKDKIVDFFHGEVKRHIELYSRIRKIANYENNTLSLKIPKDLTISIEFLSPKICDEVLDDHLENYACDVRDAKHGGNPTDSITIHLLQELLRIYYSVVNKKDYRIISKLDISINSINDIICWNLFIIYIYRLIDERKEAWEDEKDDYGYVDEKLEDIIEKYDNTKNVFDFCRELFEVAEEGEYEESFEPILNFYKSLKAFKKNNGHDINIKFRFPDEIRSILRENNSPYFSLDGEDHILKRPLSDASDVFIEEFQDYSLYSIGWSGERNVKDFMNLYSEYENIVRHLDLFMLDWGMSTGEFTLFNVFARIYSAMSRIPKVNGTEIMILFDEIDSTFHPKWQQIIIYELVNFLKLLYPEVKFQIILTTHSPVLLSDIPMQNVIFLKNQAIEEVHEQTFAANIASLYYDSFFMKEGSIGNLSHKCIENLINAMNSMIKENISDAKTRRKVLVDRFYELQHMNIEEFNSKQYEEKIYQIRNLINSVGERIWRYKLNELFEQCEVVSKENNINREFLEYIEQLKNTKGETAVIKLLKELKEKNK